MREFIIKYWLEVVFGGIITASGFCIARFKVNLRKRKALQNGVQCLLRAEIIRSYEKYAEKGYCPLYAREALERAYDSYHNLNGNDVATDLMAKIRNLPTEKEENK